MKKIYDRKGEVIAVSLSIKEKNALAKENLSRVKRQQVERAEAWLEEQSKVTKE